MSHNLLDNFEETPIPWYDKTVKAILNIPLAYRVGFIFLSVFGSVATIAFKSGKGIDLGSVLFVPIGFLFMLSVAAGILQYFFMFLSYIFEKVAGRPNLIHKLDFGYSLFILGVSTLLSILLLAFLS